MSDMAKHFIRWRAEDDRNLALFRDEYEGAGEIDRGIIRDGLRLACRAAEVLEDLHNAGRVGNLWLAVSCDDGTGGASGARPISPHLMLAAVEAWDCGEAYSPGSCPA